MQSILLNSEIKMLEIKHETQLNHLKFLMQLIEYEFNQKLKEIEQKINKVSDNRICYSSYCYNPIKINKNYF